MGCLRPYGCSPNISCCSFTCGGDCEAIEQYVFGLIPSIRRQKYGNSGITAYETEDFYSFSMKNHARNTVSTLIRPSGKEKTPFLA